ncbi:type VI secretion system lipoprotein TssJ [Celerinatantimonas sp. MCCC 1A17872]|uniref:type VI secretion system lipoprotein TssJ n=1 Tax=Celerinatantimonas sp. MCCC 1A17872 TaxID=3177514 RepID=UPI0038C23CA4
MMKWLISTVLVLSLSACSAFGGSSDKKVDYASLPSTMTLSLVAPNDVNSLDSDGVGVPIKFKVFELEDDSMLKAADYEELSKNFKSALGSNYVKDYDYILTPGQFKFVEPIQLDEDTRYIGVVANYSDPNKSQWKKVVKVKPIGHEYHLMMLFRTNEVILKEVE